MNIHSIFSVVSPYFRQKRMQLFFERIKVLRSDSLLDVGGFPAFWRERPQFCERLDVINIDFKHDHFQVEDEQPWIRTSYANALQLPYSDKSYEIVFSNSVIEHLHSHEHQIKFAQEVNRVGKRIWIQTPAYEFFIEPHYITPFIHWIPKTIRRKVLRYFTVWGWIEKPDQKTIDASIEEIKLLRFKEFQALFPDCLILREKFLGIFTKSYIAMRGD